MYTLAAHNVKSPFIVGNKQSTKSSFINMILKRVGYIFNDRALDQPLQEQYTMQSIIGRILS